MKKLIIIGTALFALTVSVTYASSKVEVQNTKAVVMDCWSSPDFDQQPDIDQELMCPGANGDCCYKLDHSSPLGYVSFAQN